MTYNIATNVNLNTVDNVATYAPGITVINPVTLQVMQYVRTISALKAGDTFSFIDYESFIVTISPNGTHVTNRDIPIDNYFWAAYVALPAAPYIVKTITDKQTINQTINYVDPTPTPTTTRGTWTMNTAYVVNDVVSDIGFMWKAINSNNTNIHPYADTVNWTLVSYQVLCPVVIPNDGDQFVVSDLNGNASVYPIEITFPTSPLNNSMGNSFIINESYGSVVFVYYGNTWRILSKVTTSDNYNADQFTVIPPVAPPAQDVTSVCGYKGEVVLTVNDIYNAASLESPTFVGVPRGATAVIGTIDSQLATTAFVDAAINNSVTVATNTIAGATTQVASLAAAIDATNAVVTTETNTRETAISAVNQQLSTLSATVTTNNTASNAAITNESTTRAAALLAVADQISTLSATVTTNNTASNAAITAESTARTSADSAEAINRQTLVAGFSQGVGKIWQQPTAPTIDDMCPIGSNRFINTAFTGVTPGTGGVPNSWGTYNGGTTWGFYVDIYEPTDHTWHLPGEHTLLISSGVPTTTTSSINQNIPVTAGNYYEASVYVSAMRVSAYIAIIYLNASNAVVGSSSGQPITNLGGQPNVLTNYVRLHTISQAPPTTVKAVVNVYCTGSTANNDWLFITRPFFGLASSTQTIPSDWTASAVDSQSWLNSSDNNRLYKWVYNGGSPVWLLADDQRIAVTQAAITSEALTRASADEANASLISTLQSSYTNQVGNTATYSVISTGNSNTIGGIAGLYVNGGTTSASNIQRSYNVWTITAATGIISNFRSFDVFASVVNATAMTTFLNSLDSSVLVVVCTNDEPQANRLANGLDTAMYRCGASKYVYGNTTAFRYRSAYLLIGIPGQGAGSGLEKYAGLTDSDPAAMCSFQFSIRAGIASGLTGRAMLDATISDIQASIVTEQTARTTATSAIATSLSTLSTTVGGYSTSVQTLQSSVDGISAQYGVTINSNNAISGFHLLSDPTTGSAFNIAADSFNITLPGYSSQPVMTVANVNGTPTLAFNGKIIQDNSVNNSSITAMVPIEAFTSNLVLGDIGVDIQTSVQEVWFNNSYMITVFGAANMQNLDTNVCPITISFDFWDDTAGTWIGGAPYLGGFAGNFIGLPMTISHAWCGLTPSHSYRLRLLVKKSEPYGPVQIFDPRLNVYCYR